jgi:hypothetical protein
VPECELSVRAEYKMPYNSTSQGEGWYEVSPSDILDVSYMTE